MISRPYSERTERISRSPAPRRGIKSRGILPSFGDIILPVVSVAAIILLVIAGRQFFVNGMKTSPGISSTRAYADAPAVVAEREKREIVKTEPTPAVESELPPAQVAQAPSQAVKEDTAPALTEVLAQPVTPAPAPAKTAATPAPKATPTKTTTTTTAKASTSSVPASQQWRVQVGAYGSKAAAQKEADKINKAGYKATVYSNPASKHVKVWVLGGADKASATKVANAMQKLGYKGSFAFPPSSAK